VGLTEAAAANQAIAAGAPLGVVYPDQGDSGIGTLVRPHIVATVAGPNRTGAERFVDFLLSEEGQRSLVMETAEMPLVAGTPLPIVGGQPIKGLNDFREMKVGYEALAELTEETAKLFAPTFGAVPGVEAEKADQEPPSTGQEKGEYQTPPSGVEKEEEDHPEGSTRP
jgi:iron(III) transport system substrate-binding protein